MERKQAYELIQKHALRAHRGEVNFREAILNDPEITKRLSRATILKCFELKPKYLDYIYKRVERATRKYGVFVRGCSTPYLGGRYRSGKSLGCNRRGEYSGGKQMRRRLRKEVTR
jgi:hypothetical protein